MQRLKAINIKNRSRAQGPMPSSQGATLFTVVDGPQERHRAEQERQIEHEKEHETEVHAVNAEIPESAEAASEDPELVDDSSGAVPNELEGPFPILFPHHTEPEVQETPEQNKDEEEESKEPSPIGAKTTASEIGDSSSAAARKLHRVKVYQLDANENWDDLGTGHVQIQHSARFGTLALVVVRESLQQEEESNGVSSPSLQPGNGVPAVSRVLLEERLYKDDIYQVQADTLIVWNDPETDADLALSFQHSQGCHEIWVQIYDLQQRAMSGDESLEDLALASAADVVRDLSHSDPIGDGVSVRTQHDDFLFSIDLPVLSVQSLPQFWSALKSIRITGDSQRKEAVEHELCQRVELPPIMNSNLPEGPSPPTVVYSNMIEALMAIFKELERRLTAAHVALAKNSETQSQEGTQELPTTQENMPVVSPEEEVTPSPLAEEQFCISLLGQLSELCQWLVLLNSTCIYDILFSVELFDHLLGVFEYDRENLDQTKHRHEVEHSYHLKMPLGEEVYARYPGLVAKIRQTFYLVYLRDCIMPRILDDNCFATINSFVYFNHCDIVSTIYNDSSLLADLFAQLRHDMTFIRDSSATNDPATEDQIEAFCSARDRVKFLDEICGVAKQLQPLGRLNFFKALTDRGAIDLMTDAIGVRRTKHVSSPASDIITELRLAAADVLEALVAQDSTIVRQAITEQRNVHGTAETLLHVCIRSVVCVFEPHGLRSQLCDVLKALLETPGASAGIDSAVTASNDWPSRVAGLGASLDSERASFILLFYQNRLTDGSETLVSPASPASSDTESTPTPRRARNSYSSSDAPVLLLLHPLTQLTDKADAADGKYSDAVDDVLEAAIDLCAFLVAHHGYRVKYTLLSHGVIRRVLRLLGVSKTSAAAAIDTDADPLSAESPARIDPFCKSTIISKRHRYARNRRAQCRDALGRASVTSMRQVQQHVCFAAIRFLRALISVKDDNYNEHLIRFGLLNPLFDLFVLNSRRYNLLNSAAIDVLDLIRRTTQKSLIVYVVDELIIPHGLHNSIKYVDTFRLLQEARDTISKEDSKRPAGRLKRSNSLDLSNARGPPVGKRARA